MARMGYPLASQEDRRNLQAEIKRPPGTLFRQVSPSPLRVISGNRFPAVYPCGNAVLGENPGKRMHHPSAEAQQGQALVHTA